MEGWRRVGETAVAAPRTVSDLLALIDQAEVFIGNDSGPGHLAAFCGIPTFTIFGPQVSDWFVPLHPQTECVEGKPCPFKPCSDYCRFPEPRCLTGISEEEIANQIAASPLFNL
jgi:heptosyltransferase-2